MFAIHALATSYRVGNATAVFLAANLEYLINELVDLAVDQTKDHEHSHIVERHISLGLTRDFELRELFRNVWLPQGENILTTYLTFVKTSNADMTW